MKELVMLVSQKGENLKVEERNLLSVAYKNVIGARRSSWRTLNVSESEDTKEKHGSLLDEYKKQIEKELEAICQDVLQLLNNNRLLDSMTTSDDDSSEAAVFYQKMAADYYRYLAECTNAEMYSGKATEYYKKAFDLAQEKLQPTHPIRLGLALNYSVCMYEIMKQKNEACELAKQAFDLAISKLDKLDEGDYKDSTLIMQLLRDNLTLWTSSNEDEA